MSFGDGNLRERVGDLNRQVDKLQRVNGELCAEINRQERRIRELESLLRDVWAAYSKKADDSFHPVWEVESQLMERYNELMEVDG